MLRSWYKVKMINVQVKNVWGKYTHVPKLGAKEVSVLCSTVIFFTGLLLWTH